MTTKILKALEPGGRAEYRLELPGEFNWLWLIFSLSWLLLRPARRIAGWLSLVSWLGRLGWLVYQARYRPFARREQLFRAAGPADYRQILDFGSGRGVVAIGAAGRWPSARLVAVDDWRPGRPGSEEALRSNLDLQGLGGRVHVYEINPAILPFDDGHFDLIISQLYLHNLKEPAARQACLLELVRLLKPGGRLILADYRFQQSDIATLKGVGLMLIPQTDSAGVFGIFIALLQPTRNLLAEKPVL